MRFRVVKTPEGKYRIQQLEGIFFKTWEYLNIYGIPLDYNHDLEDTTPIEFDEIDDALTYMDEWDNHSESLIQVIKEIEIK